MRRQTTTDTHHAIAGVLAILVAMLLASFTAIDTHAQETYAAKDLVFSVDYPENVMADLIEGRKPFDAERVVRLLSELGTVRYKGGEPVAAQMAAYITGADFEEIKTTYVTEAFRMNPGEYGPGEYLPMGKFLALFDRHFPDANFFLASAVDEESFPDANFDEERFPDSIFDPNYFPDANFDKADLERGQVGIMLVAGPSGRELQEEAHLSTAIIIFNVDGER